MVSDYLRVYTVRELTKLLHSIFAAASSCVSQTQIQLIHTELLSLQFKYQFLSAIRMSVINFT